MAMSVISVVVVFFLTRCRDYRWFAHAPLTTWKTLPCSLPVGSYWTASKSIALAPICVGVPHKK